MNRFTGLSLILLVAAFGCSDYVPPPATPTPSPLPGYPPAPIGQLPEGVLLVQQPPGFSASAPIFSVDRTGSVLRLDPSRAISIAPDNSRALVYSGGLAYIDNGIATPTMNSEFGIITGHSETKSWPAEAGFPPSPVLPSPVLWSPDGERVVYPFDDGSSIYRLRSMDLSSGLVTTLAEGASYYAPGGWTSEGGLLFHDQRSVILLGDTRREYPPPDSQTILELQVSPDGKRAAVLLQSRDDAASPTSADGEIGPPATQLMLLNPADGTWTQIDNVPAGALLNGSGQGSRLPGWSSDGTKIAYQWSNSSERGLNLFDLASGRTATFRPDESIGPDDAILHEWTKGGRLVQIAPSGMSLLDPATLDERAIRTDSRNLIQTDLLHFGPAVWSPSGRYLAIRAATALPGRALPGPTSLYIIDTEEGVARLWSGHSSFAPVAWLKE